MKGGSYAAFYFLINNSIHLFIQNKKLMKRIFIITLSLVILTLPGCKHKDSDDPRKVLSDFFDAIAKKNIDAAKKLTTDDSEPIMNMAQMAMQNMPDNSQLIQYEKENIELGDPVITGDNAIVPVKDKRLGETIDFTLKKEKSQWKVAINMSTLMQLVQKKMKEHGMNGMMNHGMNDSLNSINGNSMPNIDSASGAQIEKAQKMMDSAQKMLNDAK